MSPHRNRPRRAPASWTSRQLFAVLAATGLLLMAAVAGTTLALIPEASRPRPEVSRSPSAPGSPAPVSFAGSLEDALAAAPMPAASVQDAEPAALAAATPALLDLPGATGSGAEGVPTGFPHTPAGALAQLAAIDEAAIESGSLPGAQAVVTGWAVQGAPVAQPSSQVEDMAHLLTGLGLSDTGSRELGIELTPAMGLVKGSVGPDYAVVCIDAVLAVTYQRLVRIAVADCQRMAWSGDRWLLAAGTSPARAPAVWPGTVKSFAVGYRELGDG